MRLFDLFMPKKRLKPTFLIIGAQKAGTSALFSMLERHPSIVTGAVKELHFFDEDEEYAKGLEYYYQLFPEGRKGQVTFEATPRYIAHKQSAERIAKDLPGVKLIVVLRDPISRAYSAWNMRRDFREHPKYAHLFDPRPFDQAVDDELNGGGPDIESDYLQRGYYADQLAHYLSLFDRNDLMVVSYKAFKEQPFGVVNGILRFLNLNTFQSENEMQVGAKNRRAYGSAMDEGTRAKLEEHFKPHHEALKNILGAEFSH